MQKFFHKRNMNLQIICYSLWVNVDPRHSIIKFLNIGLKEKNPNAFQKKKKEQETYKAVGIILTSDVSTAALGAGRWWCLPLRTKGEIFPSRVL